MFIVMDIETTGLDPSKHQILEIAARIWPDTRHFYHAVFQPASYTLDWYCAAMHAKNGLLDECFNRGHKDFTSFIDWVTHFAQTEIIVLIGKNVAGFDFQFLKQIPAFPIDLFHHNCVDIGSLFWDGLRPIVSLEKLCEQYKINIPSIHRAMTDVDACIELLKIWSNQHG